MRLTPWEEERLLIFTAAELARRHRAAGLRLNAAEAVGEGCDGSIALSTGVEQVQTRPLAIDPDLYMDIARGRGAGGEAIGIPALIRGLRRARPGLVVGNFSRSRGERGRRRTALEARTR